MSSSAPSTSTSTSKKSNPVRESMLQLMQNAGIAYEIDGHDGMHENNDNDDGSLPSVPSSSNLSGYFHEELPPGYRLKTGEVTATASAADSVSSPSSVLYGPTADENDKCTDGLRTVTENNEGYSFTESNAEYSLDATSASFSTAGLEGKKAEAPSSLMMPHLLASKGSSVVSASRISDTTTRSRAPSSSIRVNSKLSKEMYKDAIKAATRGSLRRLLDAENQRHEQMKNKYLHQSFPPPIFSIEPKHKSIISRDIDASSAVSSITDTFAFSSVTTTKTKNDSPAVSTVHSKEYVERKFMAELLSRNENMMAQAAYGLPQNDTVPHPLAGGQSMTTDTLSAVEKNSMPSTQSQLNKWPSELEEMTTSTYTTGYNKDCETEKSKEEEGSFAFEERFSFSQASYGWSEPFAIKDKSIVEDIEKGSIYLQHERDGISLPAHLESGLRVQKERNVQQGNTSIEFGSGERNISDHFADEYGMNKDNNGDDFSEVYTNVDNEATTKQFKEKVRYYKYRQNNRRTLIIACICIVAILGVIVGIIMSGQLGGTNEKNDPIRIKRGAGSGSSNEQVPITSTTEPTSIPSKSPSMESTQLSSSNPTASHTSFPTEPTTSQATSHPTTSMPTSVPSTFPSLRPTNLNSDQPSKMPSNVATTEPVVSTSNQPTSQPSKISLSEPSSKPTQSPSTLTTLMPSSMPSSAPSTHPSIRPTASPSTSPTALPSSTPSSSPTKSQPTNAPSTVPTSSAVPSSSPTTPEELQRRNDMTAATVGISGATTIADTTTPQHKALEWMIRDDELQLDASSSNFVQRYSMSTFYFATTEGGGPNRRSLTSVPDVWAKCGADPLSSSCPDESQRFLSSNNECDWFGITCNANGEITDIRLKENGLSGTSLPKEIASMSSLEYLILSKNGISGTIPTEFGLLTNLERLYLNNNNIVGTIPTSLGNLNQLFLFAVGNNAMNGTIPGEIFHPALQHLDIDDNNFHGPLPDEMFTSSLDLMNIDMGGNDFGGTIPTGFGNLDKVRLLRVNNNNFVGPLPSEMFASKQLRVFNCSANGLNGSLPDALYQATSMRVLHLASNEFSGEISTKIGDLEDLKELNLRSNKFEGAIPSTLGLLGEMQSMDLSYNLFSGSMPEDVCTVKDSSVIFFDLVSDCDGDPAAVSCDCCSSCEVGYGV